MENKIKEKEVVRKQFYINCPECGIEIKGNSSSQVEYALRTHLENKHNLKK